MQLKPLVTCSYGWKRTFALYQDRIDVDGTVYSLDELVHVRSVYRTVLNIPSVRLELRFRKKDIVLRGIAAVEDAKRVVEYLDTYCADTRRVTSRLRWSRKRQAVTPEQAARTATTTEAIKAVPEPSVAHVPNDSKSGELPDRGIEERAQVLPAETPVWLQDLEQHVIYTRQQRNTQLNRSLRKYGFDVQELAQNGETKTLPAVPVPLRLLPHEEAHYCSNATLRGEQPFAAHSVVAHAVADHGKLILTNKRIVYLGRTGQLVLDYAHLTHVARQHNAIVFSTDTWSVRHTFEVQRPLECALHLDSILRQFQREVARQKSSEFEPTLREIYAHHTRTTQPRYATHTRQATTTHYVKPAIELADVETLPLSLLNHTELEAVE